MTWVGYFEDICARLLEDRSFVSEKLDGVRKRCYNDDDAVSAINHARRHLEESQKLMHEMLEILTNPQNDNYALRVVDSRKIQTDFDNLKMLYDNAVLEYEQRIEKLVLEKNTLLNQIEVLKNENNDVFSRVKKLMSPQSSTRRFK